MQNKNYLLPLLGGIGAIVAIIGLFLGAWIFGGAGVLEADASTFGFFGAFEGVEALLAGIDITFASIWATLTMISLLVGIVAVVLNVVLKLLNNENTMIGKVLAWVAGIALIAFIAFGLVFTIVNSGVNASEEAVGFTFGIGYWLGLIGLAFGTFFAFVGSCMKRI